MSYGWTGGRSSSSSSSSNTNTQYGHPSIHQQKVITRPKIRLRVSYNLQSNHAAQNHQRHCFGINSLALDAKDVVEGGGVGGGGGGGLLFSAGRDSTIRCWDTSASTAVPTHLKCFEHHTDWVNDIFLCNNYKTLVSCSSDASIKIWDTKTSTCTRTLSRHGDYVKALAYAREANVFVSAGLDSNIFIWDINQCTAPVAAAAIVNGVGNSTPTLHSSASLNSSSGFRNNVSPIVRTGCDKGSIYSLGINAAGTLVMTGSTETIVRGWDPRSGQKMFKLKGHTDNIKALVMNDEGTLCLTGGSDFTVRLWDIGQQRCVHVFEVHDDSVWALAADPSFSSIYSGSRDGSVFLTDLATSKSSLLFTEPQPILKILHSHNKGEALWISTTDSSIKCWNIEGVEGLNINRKSYSLPAMLSSSPTTTVLQGPRPEPLVSAPITTIPGRPGMVKHHILNNRRHVLTKDSSGDMQLWDVTKGEQLASFPGKESCTFEEKCEELSEVVCVPTWFSVDTKTGSVSVNLDFPQCFNAEMYAGDAGMEVQSDEEEVQINLGERVLRALFSHWLEGRTKVLAESKSQLLQQKEAPPYTSADRLLDKEKHKQHHRRVSSNSSSSAENHKTDGDRDRDKDKDKEPPEEKEGRHRGLSIGKSTSLKKSQQPTTPTTPSTTTSLATNGSPTKDHEETTADKPRTIPLFCMPPTISLTISEEGTGATVHRSPLDQLDGTEPPEIIPPWVTDCLLNNEVPNRENPKIGFFLITQDEKELSPLPQGNNRLSAHKLLKIRKVSAHVFSKLDLELPKIAKAEEDDNPASTEGDGKEKEDEKVLVENYLEILCNNKVLPPNINLATTRMFFWKSPDDLVLHYRINPEYLETDKKGNVKKKKSKMPKLKSGLLNKARS